MKKLYLLSLALILFESSYSFSQDSKEAFIKDNEIWIKSKVQDIKITNDKKPKSKIVISEDKTRIAYSLIPTFKSKKKLTSIIIIDNNGKLVKELDVVFKKDKNITSVDDIYLIDKESLGYSLHLNPALQVLRIVSINKNKIERKYYGTNFVLSPNKKHFAYLGWKPQQAPKWVSDYLKVEDIRIYPDKKDKNIKLITKPIWSQDSKYIAIIERKDDKQNLLIMELLIDKEGRITNKIKKENIPNEYYNEIPKIEWDKKDINLKFSNDKNIRILVK